MLRIGGDEGVGGGVIVCNSSIPHPPSTQYLVPSTQYPINQQPHAVAGCAWAVVTVFFI